MEAWPPMADLTITMAYMQQSEILHVNVEAVCELELVQGDVAIEHSTTGIQTLLH